MKVSPVFPSSNPGMISSISGLSTLAKVVLVVSLVATAVFALVVLIRQFCVSSTTMKAPVVLLEDGSSDIEELNFESPPPGYEALSVTDEQKALILLVVNSLPSFQKTVLNGLTLEQSKEFLDPVHPLKFLETIIRDAQGKNSLGDLMRVSETKKPSLIKKLSKSFSSLSGSKKIKDDKSVSSETSSFTSKLSKEGRRAFFLENLSTNLTREMKNHEMIEKGYMDSFLTAIGFQGEREEIVRLCNDNSWENFVQELLKEGAV